MGNLFVTADLHLYHQNIIKYCDRPFNSIEEMNETIIDNWNNTITNNDIIYLLGDFMMGLSIKTVDKSFNLLKETVGRLRAKRIYLISGNHDKIPIKLCKIKNECPFYVIKPIEYIRSHGKKITLIHKAINKDYTLHGHSHGNLSNNGHVRIDVGVDCCNYYPMPLEYMIGNLIDLDYKKSNY